MNSLLKFIATLGFVGKSPVAPGTAGSAVTAAAIWLLLPISTAGLAISALFVTVLGLAVCYAIDQRRLYGNNEDPQEIVIDEAAGVLISSLGHATPFGILLSFLMFRLFDIRKPWGIRRLEHAPHGQGIMLDDLAAGVLANLFTTLLIWSLACCFNVLL